MLSTIDNRRVIQHSGTNNATDDHDVIQRKQPTTQTNYNKQPRVNKTNQREPMDREPRRAMRA